MRTLMCSNLCVRGKVRAKCTNIVATLALGSQLKQRGYKVAGQEEAWESKQKGRKGAGQEETRESHHILMGV
jgi:hypothetical protein